MYQSKQKKHQQGFIALALLPWEKIIPALVMVAAVTGGILWWNNHEYTKGYNAADLKWTKNYNDMVEKKNDKIAAIEQDSKKRMDTVMHDEAVLRAQLADILARTKAVVNKPHTATGEVLKCDNKEVSEIYMGTDFSQTWDSINTAVNKRLASGKGK